jgi:hypothetical protein
MEAIAEVRYRSMGLDPGPSITVIHYCRSTAHAPSWASSGGPTNLHSGYVAIRLNPSECSVSAIGLLDGQASPRTSWPIDPANKDGLKWGHSNALRQAAVRCTDWSTVMETLVTTSGPPSSFTRRPTA